LGRDRIGAPFQIQKHEIESFQVRFLRGDDVATVAEKDDVMLRGATGEKNCAGQQRGEKIFQGCPHFQNCSKMVQVS